MNTSTPTPPGAHLRPREPVPPIAYLPLDEINLARKEQGYRPLYGRAIRKRHGVKPLREVRRVHARFAETVRQIRALD